MAIAFKGVKHDGRVQVSSEPEVPRTKDVIVAEEKQRLLSGETCSQEGQPRRETARERLPDSGRHIAIPREGVVEDGSSRQGPERTGARLVRGHRRRHIQ